VKEERESWEVELAGRQKNCAVAVAALGVAFSFFHPGTRRGRIELLPPITCAPELRLLVSWGSTCSIGREEIGGRGQVWEAEQMVHQLHESLDAIVAF
jgi:hypothetical protein